MGVNIQSITNDRFAIKVSGDSAIDLVFSGDVDLADPSPILDPFFQQVHQQALANGIGKVTADFRALTFLNSSGIKAIAKWIMTLSTSAQKYNLHIVQNKGITWQTTSLPTLTFLAPGTVTIGEA